MPLSIGGKDVVRQAVIELKMNQIDVKVAEKRSKTSRVEVMSSGV